jgi:hypothetical protein
MGSTIAGTTDTYECADVTLLKMISANLATFSPAERQLLGRELFPTVIKEVYSGPRAVNRGPHNALLDMLKSLNVAVAEYRSIRSVERELLGDESPKDGGPMSAEYLKVRAERASDMRTADTGQNN